MDVVNVHSRLKKRKHLRKTKNNKLKNTTYENVNWRGPSFTFSLPGGTAYPLPPVSYATGCK